MAGRNTYAEPGALANPGLRQLVRRRAIARVTGHRYRDLVLRAMRWSTWQALDLAPPGDERRDPAQGCLAGPACAGDPLPIGVADKAEQDQRRAIVCPRRYRTWPRSFATRPLTHEAPCSTRPLRRPATVHLMGICGTAMGRSRACSRTRLPGHGVGHRRVSPHVRLPGRPRHRDHGRL